MWHKIENYAEVVCEFFRKSPMEIFLLLENTSFA